MARLVVLILLRNFAIDWETWLRCIVLSTESKKAAVEGSGANATKYKEWFAVGDLLREAAVAARRTISLTPWTPTERRCCSLQCPYGGQTGEWAPRHVPRLHDRSERDRESIAKLWWKRQRQCAFANGIHCPEGFYGASDPQVLVTTWIADRVRHRGPYCPERYCVACSETCADRAKLAIQTMRLGTNCPDYGIVLGVDQLRLDGDVWNGFERL